MATALPRRLYAPTVPAYRGGVGRFVKAEGAQHKQSPEAVITYPVPDLQGDIVDAGGIDWSEFEDRYERLVNLEHAYPIGTAEVEYKSLPRVGADGTPDESLGLVALPVGVTTFFDSARDAARHTLRRWDAAGRVVGVYDADECARYAGQTYPLVMDGTLSGTSLEFQPAGPEGKAYKSLGPSPLLARDAYHFFRTRALGYAAACERPVNPFAGYAPPDELLAKAEKAVKVLERSDTLDLIRKSLTPLAGLLKTNRVTAPVRRTPVSTTATRPGRTVKADPMYDDEPAGGDMATPADAPAPEPAPADDMKPTPAALFQFSQALKDACAMADDMAARGEHVQGVKALKKFCEQVSAIADKVAAMADKVAAAVDTGEAADLDADADAEPVKTADDGEIQAKAFKATKWRPVRLTKAAPYTLKQLKAAPKAGDKETEEYLEWALEKIEQQKQQMRAAGLRAD